MEQNEQKVTIIAGPCSVSDENVEEIYRIADLKVNGDTRAIWGLRVVGLKSQSAMDMTGKGMGMDFESYVTNADRLLAGQPADTFEVPPSVAIAKKLVEDTGLTIAAEIMDPLVQLPMYEKFIPKGKAFIWNASKSQLGYPMYDMGVYAERNGWHIGIKNGKWFTKTPPDVANSMERSWLGQISFATRGGQFPIKNRIAMIQRGVDIDERGTFRNLPIHESSEKVKKLGDVRMFFDPSHSLGGGMRDQIVEYTIEAMKMKTVEGAYLYDGILIEVGTSKTDTDQHVTVEELQQICDAIVAFRPLESPEDA